MKLVDVTEAKPANVVADEPNDIAVDPTVTLLFARLAFVIPAVPDKFVFVKPEIVPLSVNVPVDVIGPPPKTIPDTVPDADIEVTVPEPPGAYEALNACVAYEAVPCNDPVIPADTLNDPVI